MKQIDKVTIDHIELVNALLISFAKELKLRGELHDASKFEDVEAIPLRLLQEKTDKTGPTPYGTLAYDENLKILKPMLDHHYANNSHHPEHYEKGMFGFDLFDLVEMFCDWKAASERNKDYSMNLTYSAKKYGIPAMLLEIMKNTAQRLNYEYK